MALRDPVAVYNAANNVEANLVKIALLNSGVQAYVTEDVSQVGVWSLGLLPEVHKPQVWVDKADLERARPILEEYERRSMDPTRSDSGEPVEGEAAAEEAEGDPNQTSQPTGMDAFRSLKRPLALFFLVLFLGPVLIAAIALLVWLAGAVFREKPAGENCAPLLLLSILSTVSLPR